MLPFFYQKDLPAHDADFELDEPTSKHCVQVLRMAEGERLVLTDGMGTRLVAAILVPHKRHCRVRVLERSVAEPRPCSFSLAIGFTKNSSRNEWLLEKATEMGIEHILPIRSARTEREKFKPERLNNILVSAMLQSQQYYLPRLHEPVDLSEWLPRSGDGQKLLAHCLSERERTPLLQAMAPGRDTIVLIGPEGDFTPAEIDLALAHGFLPISLGEKRLRTETAGLYVCTLFNALNYA